jgi:transposase
MSLLTRKYHCITCGLVLDRDVNAALNLRSLVPRASGKPLPDGPAATCVETGSSWSLKRETDLDPVAISHGFESR